MYAQLEQSAPRRSDVPIQCLSWMGAVPDSAPSTDGWRLHRSVYYQEGWLATGNCGGIVGVTFTASHRGKRDTPASLGGSPSKQPRDAPALGTPSQPPPGQDSSALPPRANFNLRGHRSEVVLVKWNEPYQKLATCDATGVIFVWIKHEGRWSIELINDRSSQVTDFTWSHDGRMALICYRDGFVLVGSVAGQRYWSSMLNLEGSLITTGVWSHDDQKVLFGTSGGQLIVLSSSGAMLTQVCVQDTVEICGLSWACERFYLSENHSGEAGSSGSTGRAGNDTRPPLLALSFRTGAIYLMMTYDDVCPKVIHTGLTGVRMEWSNDGEFLAVAGFIRLPNLECRNQVRFYNRQGVLRYRAHIPHQGKPVSALTWGHNDRRLFVAVGCHIYTLLVTKQVAPLQFLCRQQITEQLRDESSVNKLPLPMTLQGSLRAQFCHTIRGISPCGRALREFVCVPPSPTDRLHCTMIRHGEECSGGHYTLYLEYLGGLIPLLKGKRASKIRPQFIIFDPKIRTKHALKDEDSVFLSSDSSLSDSDSDFDLIVEGCGSPRMQRRKKCRRLKDRYERRDSEGMASNRTIDELMYDDNLREDHGLVEVTSNLWGTRFKLHGLASFLPEDLGQVLYKTSLLHLQPRQMTVTMVEVSPDLRTREPRDPQYNPNHFTDSEDDQGNEPAPSDDPAPSVCEASVAISPETPSCPFPLPADDPGAPYLLPGPPGEPPSRPPRPPLAPRVEQLAPLEIQALDASPPQRRSFTPHRTPPAHTMPTIAMDTSTDNPPSPPNQRLPLPLKHFPTNQRHPSPSNQVSPTLTNQKHASFLSNKDDPSPTNEHPPSPASEHTRLLTTSSPSNQNSPSPTNQNGPSGEWRWADAAYNELQYIDEDGDEARLRAEVCGDVSARDVMASSLRLQQSASPPGGVSPARARGVCPGRGDLGPLASSSGSVLAQLTSLGSLESAPGPAPSSSRKRVVLHQSPRPRHTATAKLRDLTISSLRSNTRCLDVSRGDRCTPHITPPAPRSRSQSPTPSGRKDADKPRSQHRHRRGSFDLCLAANAPATAQQPANHSASLPASPVHKGLQKSSSESSWRSRALSWRLQSGSSPRRQRSSRGVDSSDDEVAALSGDDVTTSENYRNLETFQKARLTRKLRRVRSKSDADSRSPHPSPQGSAPRHRHHVMHNKAPMWNENSQVYQLDFGGRVTQESAKNFQIEFNKKQVMQFGRIDSNAYTLDFQYPFSAVQAFAVALANVTQRLK